MTRRAAAAVIIAAAALTGCQHAAPASPPAGGVPFDWSAYVEAITSPAPTWQPVTLADLLLGPEGRQR